MIRTVKCPKCGQLRQRNFPDDCPADIAEAISKHTKCAVCSEDRLVNNDRQNQKRRQARATAPDP